MDGSLLREIAAHLETDGRFVDAVDLRRAAEVLDVAQAISDDACTEIAFLRGVIDRVIATP